MWSLTPTGPLHVEGLMQAIHPHAASFGCPIGHRMYTCISSLHGVCSLAATKPVHGSSAAMQQVWVTAALALDVLDGGMKLSSISLRLATSSSLTALFCACSAAAQVLQPRPPAQPSWPLSALAAWRQKASAACTCLS